MAITDEVLNELLKNPKIYWGKTDYSRSCRNDCWKKQWGPN